MTAAPITPPSTSARTGVWIAIAAISMSFAAYTSALLVRRSSGDWTHFHIPALLYLNTAVLLASSGTMWLAVSAAGAGRRGWLQGTFGLGFLFVAGQVWAWRLLTADHIVLGGAPSSAFFYVFTAVHAIHVIGGMAALGYVLHRFSGARPPGPSTLGAVSLYWHFMGVLWLYLLLVLKTGL